MASVPINIALCAPLTPATTEKLNKNREDKLQSAEIPKLVQWGVKRPRRKNFRPNIFKQGKPSNMTRAATYLWDMDCENRLKHTPCKRKYVRRNKDVDRSLETDMNAWGETVEDQSMHKAKSLRRYLDFDLEEPKTLKEFPAGMSVFKKAFAAREGDACHEGYEALNSNNSTLKSQKICLHKFSVPPSEARKKKFTLDEQFPSSRPSLKHFKALAREAACSVMDPLKRSSQVSWNNLNPIRISDALLKGTKRRVLCTDEAGLPEQKRVTHSYEPQGTLGSYDSERRNSCVEEISSSNSHEFTITEVKRFISQQKVQTSKNILSFGHREGHVTKELDLNSDQASVSSSRNSTPIKPSMQKRKYKIQPSTPEKLFKFSQAFETEICANQAHQETSEYIKKPSKKARGHPRYPGSSSREHTFEEEHEAAHWNDISSAQKKAEIGYLATKSLNKHNLIQKTISVDCLNTVHCNALAYPIFPSGTLALFNDPVDYITQKLWHLRITGCCEVANFPAQNVVAPYDEHGLMLATYNRNIKLTKRRPPRAKVELDPESNRMWNILMGKDCGEGPEQPEQPEQPGVDQEKWWDEERRIFQGRVDVFVARMHLIQGDRRFSKWKGSVVDSVVGAFLTQNVSDHLSSSAFMSLAASFPLQSSGKCSVPKGENVNTSVEAQKRYSMLLNASPISYRSLFDNGCFFPRSLTVKISQNVFKQESINCVESLGSVNSSKVVFYSRKNAKFKGKQEILKCQESTLIGSDINLAGKGNLTLLNDLTSNILASENKVGLNLKMESSKFPQMFPETLNSAMNTENNRAKSKNSTYDWEKLREEVCCGKPAEERSSITMDSIDWEAVRIADVGKTAEAIKERGMNNRLAERIKDFLNRVHKEHGSIDLEWLRDAPPDKVKDYLLSIRGFGLKSVECVRLLELQQLAFPVDTNVGRICVRLGWVPLQPLPESLQIHLLEQYPVLESIQKYLWPRLCKLDQRTLYELHYQMITFGKVFCTKKRPNCNACPMRGDCRHFASAFASARLALPVPEEKDAMSLAVGGGSHSLECSIQNNVEPIIEEPASPEIDYQQTLESAIEDAFCEDPDEIPTIKFSLKEFAQSLQNFMDKNMVLQDGSLSKALVALTPEVASIPMPKMKNVSRLRTEHQGYEIPDTHPLLEGLDPREPDDPSPYLLAIWAPGETSQSIERLKAVCNLQNDVKHCESSSCHAWSSIREPGSDEVRGTLLVPCRTAMRGSFPLNGTYFQVNEVFADHFSSHNPIHVPRNWIWNLPRRTVYFGTSIATIFRGLTTEKIQQCFWRVVLLGLLLLAVDSGVLVLFRRIFGWALFLYFCIWGFFQLLGTVLAFSTLRFCLCKRI